MQMPNCLGTGLCISLPIVVLAFIGKVHHHTSLLLQLAMQVDIVIDETATVGTSSYTFSTFLSNFNISTADTAEYPFLAKQQVYGYLCHLSATAETSLPYLHGWQLQLR